MKNVLIVFKRPKQFLIWALMTTAKMWPDRMYLSLMYRLTFGKWLNWCNPQTFHEKLNWLKVYDRRPEYVVMADKYAVKSLVASRIGGGML